MNPIQPLQSSGIRWQSLYPLGVISALILLLYSLATLVIVALTGGQPATIQETFQMLQDNRFIGLLRLDLLTVYVMPLYYVLFLSFWVALKHTNHAYVTLATLLVFAGLTLFLAMPSVFSYLSLSDRFAAAATQVERDQLIGAGEAIYATDLWHGTGAIVGGILMQGGAIIVSVLMLRGKGFGKATAISGIVTHGLDWIHMILIPFLPGIAGIIMVVGGTIYLIWFPLIARDLYRLYRSREDVLQPITTGVAAV